MKLDLLLSAMYLEHTSDIDHLNISGNCILINQCDKESVISEKKENGSVFTMINTKERGLCKSRNMAIALSSADICKISDNDVLYCDDYEKIILDSFQKYQNADVIVFFVKRKERMEPFFQKPQYMNYLTTLKACSVEIAFRREAVATIHFHESFGAGSGNYMMGEENIFLYDCLKKGLNILYLPIQIAELVDVESTWNTGFHENFFFSRGANYYAMSHAWSHLLIWQYAVRKIKEYKGQISTWNALKSMYRGRKKMKKSVVFIVGDHKNETAPAKVTRQLLEHMPSDTLSQKYTNKIIRMMDLLFKLPKAGKIVCSGFSKQNIVCFQYAKRHHKTSFYLMHGCIEYESQFNDCIDQKKNEIEQELLDLVDYIVAVSKPFAEWLKVCYPQYREKIVVATNGIDWQNMPCNVIKERIPNRVLSSGGGTPIKNILTICKAISLLYQNAQEKKINAASLPELFVIGPEGKDSEEIRKFPFVKDLGLLSQEEVFEQMSLTKLYVQNSALETFGLAAVEALGCGCDLLLSKGVGAFDVIQKLKDLDENHIIENGMDIFELSEKIAYLLSREVENKSDENDIRIKYETSVVKRSLQLYELIQKM